MSARPQVRITVAICTYNRSNSLVHALESLEKQESTNDFSWELLLIDNNSSDETSRVAKRFTRSLPLTYLFEPVQGLSAARNRALQEFKGDLLVFTDDDVMLDSKWLYEYASAERQFPEASYFGGRILPLWHHDKPRWLIDPSLSLISGLLVHYDLGEESHFFRENDPLPFGANFALRRSLTQALAPFRLDLGVRAGSAGRGEEAEYLDRARTSGARGVYLGHAVCHHRQDPRRFRISYLYNYGIEKGRASALMGRAEDGRIWLQLQFALKGLLQLLKGRGDRFRQCVINVGIQRGLMLEARHGSLSP